MIDICVLTAGRFDLLEQCLDAIESAIEITPCKCNLYVFDNGSLSEERMKNKYLFTRPSIKQTKRANNNVGFPAGANSVIGMGTDKYILFVSDDVILYKDAIASLYNTLQENNKIGLCGLKLLFPKNSTDNNRPAGKVQHVGHSIDLHGQILHPFIGWSENNPKCCVSGERFSVTGAAFMMPRLVFNLVRGFNSDYGLGYFEDVEMALNIYQLGYKIWVDTNAIGEHYVGATFSIRKETSQLQQNAQKFIERNKHRIRWTDWEIR